MFAFLHLGLDWRCAIFACALALVCPASFAVSPYENLSEISFDDLAISYNNAGEARWGSLWSPADDSMTAILEEYVRIAGIDSSFYPSPSGLFVNNSSVSSRNFRLAGAIPFQFRVSPTIYVNVDNGVPYDSGASLFFDADFDSEGVWFPSFAEFCSLLADNTLSETTDGVVTRHSFASLKPFVEIYQGGELPPPAAVSSVTYDGGSNCSVVVEYVLPWRWDALSGYSAGGFHLSLNLHPVEYKFFRAFAPLYPAPFWADSYREPSVYLSPSDMQYFLACCDDAGIPSPDMYEGVGFLIPVDDSGVARFDFPINLNLIFKSTEGGQ